MKGIRAMSESLAGNILGAVQTMILFLAEIAAVVLVISGLISLIEWMTGD